MKFAELYGVLCFKETYVYYRVQYIKYNTLLEKSKRIEWGFPKIATSLNVYSLL